jgi:LysM repeat protein
MKKAAVAIDPYKLPVFEKHLKAAGYTYEVVKGKAFWVIQVQYEWAHLLKPIIEAANKEATK